MHKEYRLIIWLLNCVKKYAYRITLDMDDNYSELMANAGYQGWGAGTGGGGQKGLCPGGGCVKIDVILQ